MTWDVGNYLYGTGLENAGAEMHHQPLGCPNVGANVLHRDGHISWWNYAFNKHVVS